MNANHTTAMPKSWSKHHSHSSLYSAMNQSSMLFFKNMRHALFVVAILLLAPVVDSASHLDTITATAVVSENRQNLNVQNADDHQTVRKKSSL